jgi:hypothetical protein
MKNAAWIVTFLLVAGTAHAGWFDECEHRAHRAANLNMAGVSRVVVIAKAGSLRVEGRDGARTIAASGEACASEDSVLRDITLTATLDGSTARIEAHVPSVDGWSFFGGDNAQLDLTVTLPPNVPVEINDTSGGMTVVNVGTCSIDDTSGEIDVRRVHGDLTIHDTSGAILVEDVDGSVQIPRDGSGEIEVRRVKRNVWIGYKGSGSIYVSDVAGDFTVDHKGSGGIDYSRVAGRVNVPERHRR